MSKYRILKHNFQHCFALVKAKKWYLAWVVSEYKMSQEYLSALWGDNSNPVG